jgi:transcriptional regulator with XRE-family HTH domain
MPTANEQIGAAIRRARKKAGLTQPELAQALKVAVVTIKKYEGGNISILATRLDEIAAILQTSINNLLPSARKTRSKK